MDAFELSNENLKVELWARSPLVYSPVAMDFDAKGRLWLTEGIDYNQRPRVDTGRSVMVLEDKDGDGKADTSKVFVTEKEIRHAPLGIAVFDNRIVLSSTPSIIVYTDVNRNAVFEPEVDKREVFLTGFPEQESRSYRSCGGWRSQRTMAFFLWQLRGRYPNQGWKALSLRLLLRISGCNWKAQFRWRGLCRGNDDAHQPGRNRIATDRRKHAEPPRHVCHLAGRYLSKRQ